MDADADLTEFDENSQNPYAILRDDPFALLPPKTSKRWDEKRLTPPPHPQSSEPPSPTEVDGITNPQSWSPESTPFATPHIHLEDTDDLVSAESQSIHDTDEFRTPDSVDEDSTDVPNPYRKVSWTDKAPQPSKSNDDTEAELDDKGHTSAFQDSPSHPQEAPTHMHTPEWEESPSHTANPSYPLTAHGSEFISPSFSNS